MKIIIHGNALFDDCNLFDRKLDALTLSLATVEPVIMYGHHVAAMAIKWSDRRYYKYHIVRGPKKVKDLTPVFEEMIGLARAAVFFGAPKGDIFLGMCRRAGLNVRVVKE